MISRKKRLFSAFLALLLLFGTLLSVPVSAKESYSDEALRTELSLLADQWDLESRSADADALRDTLRLAALSPRLKSLYDSYGDAVSLPTPDGVAKRICAFLAAYYTPGAYYVEGALYEEAVLQMMVRCYRAALNEAAWKARAEKVNDPEWRELLEQHSPDAFLLTLAEEQYERAYVKDTKYRPFAEAAGDVLQTLEQKYGDTVKKEPEKITDYAVRSYCSALSDTYASFYNPEEELERQKQNAKGFVGIGVTMRRYADGRAQVLFVNPSSPAEEAGVKSGDLLTAVDGVPLTAENADSVLSTLVGIRGSSVSLTLDRNGTSLTVSCVRNDVTNVTVIAELLEGEDCKIGYIRLTRFTESTYSQFKAAVESLREKGAEGFLFDVRDNPGGMLNSVLDVLAYVLPVSCTAVPDGTLVRLKYHSESERLSGKDRDGKDSDPHEITEPILVLCNENTASAGELFVSTLLDWNVATVIGTPTFGKGMGQEGVLLTGRDSLGGCHYGTPLTDGAFTVLGARLFLSTFYYSPPISANYDGSGITPAKIVALEEEWQSTSLYLLPRIHDKVLGQAVKDMSQTLHSAVDTVTVTILVLSVSAAVLLVGTLTVLLVAYVRKTKGHYPRSTNR